MARAPAGFEAGKRYPTLLTIHGGPFTQYGTGFFDEVQVYAGARLRRALLEPARRLRLLARSGDARSAGHGQRRRPRLGHGRLRGLDGASSTRRSSSSTFLDADRLGVLGGSYGGYMTSWIIGHTKRFKAALSERAVNNLVSMFGSSDLFWVFERQFGGPMWEDVDAYLRDVAGDLRPGDRDAACSSLHSENDLRCNIEQGEHLFTLLRLLGKEVEMLRFPAESHELSRSGLPVHRVQRFEAILEWFGRYLSPGA